MHQNKSGLWVIVAHAMKKFDETGFSRHRLGAVVGLFPLRKVIVNFKFD
jgi:hypothetical protein